MKKIFYISTLSIILVSSIGFYVKSYNRAYNTQLPEDYSIVYEKYSKQIHELNENEKRLFNNFIERSIDKSDYPLITIGEAIKEEYEFEKSNDGILYFKNKKEQEKLKEITETLNQSLFLTYIDNNISQEYINIIYAVKNKSSSDILEVRGDGDFFVNNEHYYVKLGLNQVFRQNSTSVNTISYKLSEYPGLRDLTTSNNTKFKFNIQYIRFSDGKVFSLIDNSDNPTEDKK